MKKVDTSKHIVDLWDYLNAKERETLLANIAKKIQSRLPSSNADRILDYYAMYYLDVDTNKVIMEVYPDCEKGSFEVSEPYNMGDLIDLLSR